MLSEREIIRYSRHIRLDEIGGAGQEKMKQASVLVVGAGGLGCPVLQYLTAAGIGTIGILDYDTVDESNLQRQVLFDTGDIGKPKVIAAKARLSALNPYIIFHEHFVKLTKSNALDIFKNYDIIVEGSDNFPTRYLTNDACVILGKPLVYGAVERFNGQLTVFNYRNGPTLRCLCPDPPDPFEIPSCSEVGIVGVLPGIIGTLQASEVIKIITGIGEPLSGKLLLFDALTLHSEIIFFTRDPESGNISELKDYTDVCTFDNKVKTITSGELKKLLEHPEKLQIIDLREADNRENFSLQCDSIPLVELTARHHLVAKDKTVVFVCRYGVKSITACSYMERKHGYDNVFSLDNGIAEWNVLFGC